MSSQGPSGCKLAANFFEVFGGRTAALIKLNNSHVLFAFQNPTRQPRQHAGRTDFHKRAHARFIEPLHHAYPSHRIGHLANQALSNVARTLKPLRGGAAKRRNPGLVNRQSRNGLREFFAR